MSASITAMLSSSSPVRNFMPVTPDVARPIGRRPIPNSGEGTYSSTTTSNSGGGVSAGPLTTMPGSDGGSYTTNTGTSRNPTLAATPLAARPRGVVRSPVVVERLAEGYRETRPVERSPVGYREELPTVTERSPVPAQPTPGRRNSPGIVVTERDPGRHLTPASPETATEHGFLLAEANCQMEHPRVRLPRQPVEIHPGPRERQRIAHLLPRKAAGAQPLLARCKDRGRRGQARPFQTCPDRIGRGHRNLLGHDDIEKGGKSGRPAA